MTEVEGWRVAGGLELYFRCQRSKIEERQRKRPRARSMLLALVVVQTPWIGVLDLRSRSKTLRELGLQAGVYSWLAYQRQTVKTGSSFVASVDQDHLIVPTHPRRTIVSQK
jgi:hypothetical protein